MDQASGLRLELAILVLDPLPIAFPGLIRAMNRIDPNFGPSTNQKNIFKLGVVR
jgi:hypothetical protein